MQHLNDYKKFAILYVDDEEKSLKYFLRAFEDQFRCVGCDSNGTTTSTPEAAGRGASHPNNLAQLMWASPITNRVLLEAGGAVKVLRWGSTPCPRYDNPELIRITEQAGLSPGLVYRAPPREEFSLPFA